MLRRVIEVQKNLDIKGSIAKKGKYNKMENIKKNKTKMKKEDDDHKAFEYNCLF